MLEKPDLQDQRIIARLQDEYGLQAGHVTFLPLGADVNTAVYRVVTQANAVYFLKLRKGVFDETTVAVPQFLRSRNIEAIIAPLETLAHQAWGSLDVYTMVLYPFIEGKNGYQVVLPDQQWIDFGAALKGIHSAPIPAALDRQLQRETYSPQWREIVRRFQAQVESATYDEPVAARLAGLMRENRSEISRLVGRAEQLGLALQARPRKLVLCHSDLHPGNLLIGENLYVVDWDNPILAPKERDLMYVAAGMDNALPGGREEALFYLGYGPVQIDSAALSYYRYERIVQDVAAFCEQLLLTIEGGEDREQSYQYFASQFLPDSVVEIAFRTDASSSPCLQ
jgi:spectinomycin phosphotransferase